MISLYNIQNLTTPKYQNLVRDYCLFLNMGHKHFSNTKLSYDIKLKKLDLLDKSLRKNCPLKNSLIAKLQRYFLQENLSIGLLLDPLIAWRYLAYNKLPASETQLSDILSAELTPLARLLMALHDENPATYLPVTSLLVMLDFLQLLTNKNILIKHVKMSKKQRLSKMLGLLKNAKISLCVIHSLQLKFRLAWTINTANVLLRNFQNNKHLHCSFLDYIRIFLYSLAQFIFVRKKSISNKGV